MGRGGVWAIAFLSALQLTMSEPCLDRPKEAIVQLTEEECKCCYDLDEFIQDNDYVYVLFYSNKGRLNVDIGAKFEQLAQDWKHSRIAFGRIDTDKDREMAKKWVEPHMVPTNVMYKFGRPVEVQPKDFEQIRDRYHGSPEGQKWMLTKYLGEDSLGTNLHYAPPIMAVKKLHKFVSSNEIAVAGFFKKEGDVPHRAFHEAVWQLHQDIDREDIGAAVGTVISQTVAKKEQVEVPKIIVYVDGKAVEEDGEFAPQGAKGWTPKAVVDFMRQFLPLSDQDYDEGAERQDL